MQNHEVHFFSTGEEVLSSDSSIMFSQYNNSYLKKSRKHDSSGYDPIKTFQRQSCVSVLIQQASRSAALQACVRKSGINMRACSCYRRKRISRSPLRADTHSRLPICLLNTSHNLLTDPYGGLVTCHTLLDHSCYCSTGDGQCIFFFAFFLVLTLQ